MKMVFHGNEFTAVYEATKYAVEHGLVVGSMARDMPMGLADATKYDSVAKWYNLDEEEKLLLSGVIVGDKRNGPVALILFDEEDNLDNIPNFRY